MPGTLNITSKSGGYYDFADSESNRNFTGSVYKPSASNLPAVMVSHNKVDGEDYMIWMLHFNQNISGRQNGDYGDNDLVNISDYYIWFLNF